jgi:myo-inositol-1(or 4)-monophosphatase
VRRTGSTALNLAYVAASRFDGFWAFDSHPWDVAGGAVLVREAGGLVTNVDGTAFDPYTPDGLASNGRLHSALLEAFRRGP